MQSSAAANMRKRASASEAIDVWDNGDWKVESYDDLLKNMGIQIVNGQMVAVQPVPIEMVKSLPPSTPIKTVSTTTQVVLPDTSSSKSKAKKTGATGATSATGAGNGSGAGAGGYADASLVTNYNALGGHGGQNGFIPNSNLVQPPPVATAIPPEVQNSYIFNKYFKKEFGEPEQTAVPQRGTVEHLNYRLRNYLEWLRVQKIKSKKMTFY